MSGTTSVPRPVFTATGFLLPTEADILAGVLADLQACFGGGLNPAPETPQGQLASTQTAIISDTNDQFLLLTQNVDPSYAQGRMQDGIARIYFLERNPALPTTVQATCRGLQGVVIPPGVLAKATDGNFYAATGGGTIGADGTVTLPFQCDITGPVACPTGSLNQVWQVIPGWDSIFNNSDGVVGQDVESRAQFERRRYNSVAANSMGMLASVQGAVLSAPNVLDAYTTENFTDTPVILDGITLPPHSLYVCAAGGLSSDIAHAIFTKKAPGCNMAGSTTVVVTDDNGGYAPPAPSYQISFQIAIPQTFIVNVTLVNSPSVPQDALIQVRNAILTAWAGDDGGSRARIGSIVYASRYYAPVARLGAWVQLVSIKLGSTAAGASAGIVGSVPANSNVLTVTAGSGLAVGQTLVGNGIPDGTQIASLGTGIGGVGTYNLNQSLVTGIPAGTAITSMVATLDDVHVGIAHVPVLSAANISVALVASP